MRLFHSSLVAYLNIYFLYHVILATHQDVQKKHHDEIDRALPNM
ncbi:hypothetical protein U0070_009682, partial [Myodes glareolus]